MLFGRSLTWFATALALALAIASVFAVEGASEPGDDDGPAALAAESADSRTASPGAIGASGAAGCSVTEGEYRADDGSRRTVRRVSCDDGTVRAFERRYDARGNLERLRAYEIAANGAVRLVEDSGAESLPGVAAGTPGSDSARPGASAGEAGAERIQDWLNAKFKEWKADVEAREAARRRRPEAGGD